MTCAVGPEFLSLYQWEDLVYVSQISSENGHFRLERSEAQTFCVPLNNLTVLNERGGLVCRHVGEVLWSACLLYFKFKPGFHMVV